MVCHKTLENRNNNNPISRCLKMINKNTISANEPNRIV